MKLFARHASKKPCSTLEYRQDADGEVLRPPDVGAKQVDTLKHSHVASSSTESLDVTIDEGWRALEALERLAEGDVALVGGGKKALCVVCRRVAFQMPSMGMNSGE
jgi:hypothetical protein